ncbi:triple tyrosine motif-containing protein [Persicobacter diffluens]|uniref:Two component regulator three Y domain-containing protein n=1 Tax=Persicobacter diffluens TaxID=981 RepID=A0AAN5AKS2_9BACT|nr:hypothetical protein PEDI_36970 [Persicobacter diffluens]
MKNSLLIFFLLFIIQNYPPLYGQVTGVRRPDLRVFHKEDYGAENKNWDIHQSDKGLLLVANTLGLLSFDGEEWQLFKTELPIRCVYAQNDTIYVGGDNTLGYFLEEDLKSGFHSLAKIKSDIWKIFPFNDRIVFQSFDRFYFLDQGSHIGYERINVGNTTYAYEQQNRIYYQITYGRLYYTNLGGELREVALKQPSEIAAHQMMFIQELNEEELLLGSLNQGMFLLKEGKMLPLPSRVNELLKKYRINHILPLPENRYAFGTMDGGLIIGDLKGNIDYHLNTQSGLPNNRIHSLYRKDHLLWIGTDNGLAMLDLSAPLSFIADPYLQLGSVYDIAAWDNTFLLATNQGLFQTEKHPQQFPNVVRLNKINGSEGQNWNIEIIEGKVFLGHNGGTFIFNQGQLEKISHVAGGYKLLKSRKHPHLYYQTAYFGLAVYEQNENGIRYLSTLREIATQTRDLIELPDGKLMVTTIDDNGYLLEMTGDGKSIQSLEVFPFFEGEKQIRAFSLKDRAIVTSSGKTMCYSDGEWTEAPKGLRGIQYLSEPLGDYYLVKKDNKLVLYHEAENKMIPLPQKIAALAKKMIYRYEHIGILSEHEFAVSLAEGIAIFDLTAFHQQATSTDRPKILEVAFYQDQNGNHLPEFDPMAIPYRYNSVNFKLSDFNFKHPSTYHYFLRGYHDHWQPPTTGNHISFQNLPHGHYTLHLKSDTAQQEVTYSFVIKPPLLLSAWALAGYCLLLLALIYGFFMGLKIHHKKQKLSLLKKERERLNKIRLINHEKLLEMEANQLKNEIEYKTEELSKLLLQNNKKKEIIDQIKEEIVQIRHQKRYVQPQDISKLNRIIDRNFDEKKDWAIFESAFTETHAYFFKKLKKTHPELSEEDLRLCAYLKVNLTSKEIAPIFNITPRSVELKRYRLKKKMGLEKDVHLKQYIQGF